MGKLIKCHFYYLMNKLTIAIFVISIIGIMLFALINVLSLDERMDIASFIEYYYSSLFEICKIIGNIIVVLLFGYSFSSLSDGYHAITITKQNPRSKYLISKLILLFSIFTFLYLLTITTVVVISLVFKIILSPEMLVSFFNLYIILIYYGLLSTLLMMAVDNIYIVFVLVPLSFINYEKNLYFLTFLMPIEDKTKIARTLILPLWYYLIFIIATALAIIIIWSKKDLS